MTKTLYPKLSTTLILMGLRLPVPQALVTERVNGRVYSYMVRA